VASLDNLSAIMQLDQENMLSNIQDFPDQVERCWADWKKIALPTSFINAKTILILGMGGSAQGGGLAQGLAGKTTEIPIISLRDYDIPGWVDKNTLVIAVSYSGNTEETLEALSQAGKKTDKIITVSTGGKLYSLGSHYKALHYQIHYGSQPRAALGYTFTSILAIFKKLNLLEITDEDIKEALLLLRALQKKLDVEIPSGRNTAKILAEEIDGRIPIIFASSRLKEVARRWKSQFNENSQVAAYFEVLPELNHNSLVGLDFPAEIRKKLFFFILESKYDHPRNRLRENITAQILQEKRIPYETIMMQPAGNPLSEMLQIIYLGDYVSYYLAILNNVAPNPVGIIEVLKGKLAEKPFERSKNG